MSTLVMKYGGSLTSDARRIARIAQITIAERLAWKNVIVVVSAMGGVTDLLLKAIDLALQPTEGGASTQPRYRAVVATIRDQHTDVVRALIQERTLQDALITRIDAILFNFLTVCDRVRQARMARPNDKDAAIAAGEKMMAEVITVVLRQEGLPRVALVEAELLIVTDDHHQHATPIADAIDERVEAHLRPLLENRVVPVVPGFIGATRAGAITTLGRGGSDYTAALLAVALKADECWIWTHVDGIMSADPQIVPGAQVLPALSYQEVGELSYFGARLLHPHAVEPLAAVNIPLRVRNPFHLDHAGTLISAEASEQPARTISTADGVCLTSTGQPMELREVLSELNRLVGGAVAGPVIAMQSYYRALLVFVIPTTEGPTALDDVIARLSGGLSRWQIAPVKVIAVTGAGDFQLPEWIVPIGMTTTPEGRRVLAVQPSEVQNVVRALHKLSAPPVAVPPVQPFPPPGEWRG